MLSRCVCLLLVILGGAPLAASDLDQEIILTPHEGALPADAEIRRWQERAGRADATAEVFERLAWAWVSEARRTLDPGYYKLAEKTVAVLERRFGSRPEARLVRGHVQHNLHHFRAAEETARTLVAERGAPADLALLSDVLIERGNLTEGAALLQQFVNAKPGLEAFSRIAHLRWLKGDLRGARDAMRQALGAARGQEAEIRAWLLNRLAGYELQAGRLQEASGLADTALIAVPDYAPALLTRGRCWLAARQTGEAITALRRAADLQPLPEYQWWLADALALAGRDAEARGVEESLHRKGAAGDPRTYALFLATRGLQPATARRLASAELEERSDAASRDALAWALASAGELDAAAALMRAALASGIDDARLWLHAGEIARRRGETAQAETAFAAARRAAFTLTPSEAALLPRPVATTGP